MKLKRLVAAALLLGSALTLSACGGTVADMWPHWAGGEPAGLPPRPGQPGYQEFIAHGQPGQDAGANAAAPLQQAPSGTTAAIAQQKSAAPPPGQAAPPQENSEVEPAETVEHPVGDTGVVRGGLY